MGRTKPRVFIGSSKESLPVAYALRQQLQGDASVKVWDQGVFGLSEYTLDVLLKAVAEFDFAIFVFAADDTVELRGKRYIVARDNVILESGLFVGRLGRERTYIVTQETREPLHLPSDLNGLVTARFRWPGGAPFQDVEPAVLRAALRPSAQSIRAAIKQVEVSAANGQTAEIEGKRLFEHRGYYPIDIAPETNIPHLNRDIFLKAIRHFLKEENHDRLAAMDLVYLREDNLNLMEEGDILKEEDMPLYQRLVEKYGLLRFIENFREENERLFRNFERIVNDIGDTLRNVRFEILLHNIRNPLRSIVAARNTHEVSGRPLYAPSTRFVVQFVKNQGKLLIRAMEGGSKVSYVKQFNRIKQVKATTTPLYHEKYGLIGILCVNIDIDAINALDYGGLRTFRQNYVWTTGETPDFEKEDWGVG